MLFQKTKDGSFPRDLTGPGVTSDLVNRRLLVSLIKGVLSGVGVEGIIIL